MPTTYVDYTATAAQTDFAFSFPYLEDEHIIVEINGVATTDFTIATTPSTKVVLNVGATAGQIVRVRRKSQPDTNLVDFVNGSVLTESELDRAYQHNRFLNEEIAELNDASLQLEAGGTQWDAKSLRIKNVDTPTETADATTKNYVDTKVNQVSSGTSFPPTKWVFTGDAGANTTYSVTGAEILGDTAYDVSIDGAVKEPTTDYTVDPDTDTLTIVPTLSGGEDIVVIERGFGIAITTGTVGSSQIATNAITTNKIADDAVTTDKIADDAVTTDEIADSAVTSAKTDFSEVLVNSASGNGRVEIGGLAGAYVDLKTPNTDDYDGRIWIDGDEESLKLIGKYGVDFKVGLSPSLVGGIDSNGDLNITGVYKKGGSNLLLDEDTMSSNSDTQGATQQSIKAYVDSQVVSTISKYTSSWFNDTTGLTNGGTYSFSHTLGTADIQVQVYMATSSGGASAKIGQFDSNDAAGASDFSRGLFVTNVTSSAIEVQLGGSGWVHLNSSGGKTSGNWGTTYTHIKVVAIG